MAAFSCPCLSALLLLLGACTSTFPPQDPLRDAAAMLEGAPPASASPPPLPVWAGVRALAFAPLEGPLANPERGLYARVDIIKDDAAGLAAATTTLLHTYLRLDAFRQSPLPAAWLDALAAGLSAVAQAEKKVILRFAYNHGPWPKCEPDASAARILEHVQQVAPVLAAHAGVIAWFEAGFVGCWGEWHTSTHGLEANTTAKVNVVAAMLTEWPERAIQLRYPADLRMLRQLLPSTLRKAGHADPEGAVARLGFHHDCVFASVPDDYGTWGRRGGSIESDKALVAATAETAPTGGETCVLSPRATCEIALAEFEAQRWTNLNKDFNREVLDLFAVQGCFDVITERLGYRLALVDAAHDERGAAHGVIRFAFRLQNGGWAPLYNKRPLRVVLDGPARVELELAHDVRRIRPGKIELVEGTLPLPGTLPDGRYHLAVWLPDLDPKLASVPAYAVQLANAGVWQASTGLNVLGAVQVGAPDADAGREAASADAASD